MRDQFKNNYTIDNNVELEFTTNKPAHSSVSSVYEGLGLFKVEFNATQSGMLSINIKQNVFCFFIFIVSILIFQIRINQLMDRH